ncbi:hypothetical protein [Tautonia sociabilis]|uniref:Zinc ribbon domain-containing protein n=1 Tax=Tautonia sociabilis TaxID=2080755 RepID=A0A432MEB9_9BACT|nr:hypothetical protein [Tautonia sociabilis]RUL83649.1 hypothetical protein TsocGM_21690 [Tautonia sociabilis]
MAKATCRCGQPLTVPDDRESRVVCPSCGAKVRVKAPGPEAGDGFLRFACPCGRRLKVPSDRPPTHGKCPDCGRIVPVPNLGGAPEQRTDELLVEESQYLEQWAADHRRRGSRVPVNVPPGPDAPPQHPQPRDERVEAGLRLCPRCARPVHLGSEVCRHCGTSVPRR